MTNATATDARPTKAPVNTKTAPRTEYHFKDFNDVGAFLDRVETALANDSVRMTGNWSLGENCDHCAIFVQGALDGFKTKAPLPFRLMGRYLIKRKAMSDAPMPRGIKLPKSAKEVFPTEGISDAQGLANLKAQVDRVRHGEKMTHDSPLFGPLTHDEWVHLQLKHLNMHLGFVSLEG